MKSVRINFNEGGRFLTFFWGRGFVRIWFRPVRGITLSKSWSY
jgi:hypothetical protein